MQTLGQKNILIIDDDKLVLKSLSALFIKKGWNVNLCQNGSDGLRQVESKIYDCILLDIRMPNMDGTQVLEHLRDLEAENKIKKQNVIIMTGYADENAAVKVFQLDAFNYIHKPFDIDELLEKVSKCIEPGKFSEVLETITDERKETDSLKKLRKSYDSDDMLKKADILAKQ